MEPPREHPRRRCSRAVQPLHSRCRSRRRCSPPPPRRRPRRGLSALENRRDLQHPRPPRGVQPRLLLHDRSRPLHLELLPSTGRLAQPTLPLFVPQRLPQHILRQKLRSALTGLELPALAAGTRLRRQLSLRDRWPPLPKAHCPRLPPFRPGHPLDAPPPGRPPLPPLLPQQPPPRSAPDGLRRGSGSSPDGSR